MKIEVKSYSSATSLISSIIFFIAGALLFTNPTGVVKILTYIIGGLLIVIGLFECVRNYLDIKKDNSISSSPMIMGIVLCIVGIVFIFLAGAIEAAIRFVLGAWILFSGINRLINVLELKQKNKDFVIMLVVSIALILCGLYIILKSNLVLQTVGIVMMIYSAIEIFGYIFAKKENIIFTTEEIKKEPTKDTPIKEATVIEDKTKKEDKKKNTKNKADSNK